MFREEHDWVGEPRDQLLVNCFAGRGRHNRLPTLVLQNQFPYSKLYNRDSDYQKLRVFGCLCYPLLRPYGLHKLEYRSKPCIFLDYSYVSYKCLDLVTNKVYLSKHVIFNENSFPAKDQATTQLPSKINAQGDAPLFLPISLPLVCFSLVELDSSAVTTSLEQTPFATLHPDTNHLSPRSPTFPLLTNHAASPLSPTTTASPIPYVTTSSSSVASLIPHVASPLHRLVYTIVTRSQTNSLKPKTFPEFHLYHT